MQSGARGEKGALEVADGTDLAHGTKPNLQEDIYSVLDDAPPCQCEHTDDYYRSSTLLFW